MRNNAYSVEAEYFMRINLKKYAGKIVAIMGKRVVAFDTNPYRIRSKLKKLGLLTEMGTNALIMCIPPKGMKSIVGGACKH